MASSRASAYSLTWVALGGLLTGTNALGATLPAHGPLRILEISDEVNPNNLGDAELTQPGDISRTLTRSGSGLMLESDPVQVDSQCVDKALEALNGSAPPHVVIYFAHRPALSCAGSSAETELVAGFKEHLVRGGGIVVFHHGAYQWSGKDEMLKLLGVSATGISWNTTEGQRVINVAKGHFVSTNGVSYTGSAEFNLGPIAPQGTYSYFDNIPDERYPTYSLTTETGELRTVLFASTSGGTRVLSYALERSGWLGRVVAYQPGEYQPNALDALDGPNFQILANAIVYSVRQEGGNAPGSGGASSGGANAGTGGETEPAGGSLSVIGGRANEGGGGVEAGGTASGTGATSSATGGHPQDGLGGHASSTGGATQAGGTLASPASGGASEGGGPDLGPAGCGCFAASNGRSGAPWLAFSLLSVAQAARRFRRRKAPRADGN